VFSEKANNPSTFLIFRFTFFIPGTVRQSLILDFVNGGPVLDKAEERAIEFFDLSSLMFESGFFLHPLLEHKQ
jgi:hypothetical protein